MREILVIGGTRKTGRRVSAQLESRRGPCAIVAAWVSGRYLAGSAGIPGPS
jgi:hypothetical protein